MAESMARGAATAGAQFEYELIRLAQTGDAASLGQVLTLHRAEMMAVALAILGRPADAEDVVQDAMLVALSRIGDLRDPRAFGPWLKMIVRNCCRMRLRGPAPVLVSDLSAMSLPGGEGDPADVLERHAFRNWMWHAMEQLSPPLRLVMMLRYFTDAVRYEQIGAICGVPVGIVRSRLSKARAKLSQELLMGASAPHQDVAALTCASRQEAWDLRAPSERFCATRGTPMSRAPGRTGGSRGASVPLPT